MDDSRIWFTWLDYALFFGMLSFSALIGVYFGCKKNKGKDEYLLGGKTMKVVPIATSLIASNTSGIILMAIPADVYQYGASFIWAPIAIIVSVVSFIYIYMPVLVSFEYETIFEYLEKRFNRSLRLLASAFFVLQILLNNPILIFIPTLAFAQVSGFSIHSITIIVCSVCIFYTTIGGLKAVVWTDTLQTLSMCLSVVAVFGIGLYQMGGLKNVWDLSVKGERLDVLRFNVDLTDRNSFWSIVTGFTAVSLNNVATHQATVQRLMAVPTYSDAKRVLWLFLIGIVIIDTFAAVMGLLVYSYYAGCDPVTTEQVMRYDQILPYFVMDVSEGVMGLSGLFVAGIFSAALSSLSTNLNTLAAVIYADFLSPRVSQTIKEKHENTILKFIVVISGVLCIGSVFVVERLGGIIPLATCFLSITGGPLLGLFTLGITCPRANSKGALVGGTVGVAFITWIVIGSIYYQSYGLLQDISKPASTVNCTVAIPNGLQSLLEETSTTSEDVFILYRINFWWYTPLGTFVTIVVGYLTSLLTLNSSEKLNIKLIAPWFQTLTGHNTNIIKKPENDFEMPLKTDS